MNGINKFFQRLPIQAFISIMGLVVVILNLWVASKLSPLALDISKINGKVNAIEESLKDRPALVERFIQLEERDKELINKVNNIDKRIDILINQHIDLKTSLK